MASENALMQCLARASAPVQKHARLYEYVPIISYTRGVASAYSLAYRCKRNYKHKRELLQVQIFKNT